MPITLQQAADKLDAVASDFGAFVTWAQGTPTGGPFGDGRYRLGVALDAPALACPAAWQAGYASRPRLTALGNLAVVSATTTAQPASPAEGAVYILPAGKTGAAWGGMANGALAYWRDGAWEQIAPREGWLAYAQDADQMLVYTGTAWAQFGSGVTDGNKGAITVLGSAWSINANAIGTSQIASGAVTYAKLQNISASDRVLGRQSTGAGPPEEISFTAAARALCAGGDAAAMRATLGLGSAATQNIGTSGANVPLLNGAHTWTGAQQFSAAEQSAFNGTSHSAPATTGTTQTGSGLRVTSGNTSLTLDFGGNNTGGTWAWLQSCDRTSLGTSYELRINPNGGNVRVGGNFSPISDGVLSCGEASNRFAVVYASTGTINTSDAREKTQLEPVNDALRRAAARIKAGIGAFQWLEAVERKGADRARIHIGVTAQAVRDAFVAEGLDPGRYALFCEDVLTEAGDARPTRPTRLGVRMDQVLALMLLG